jgi:hypothetical protein
LLVRKEKPKTKHCFLSWPQKSLSSFLGPGFIFASLFGTLCLCHPGTVKAHVKRPFCPLKSMGPTSRPSQARLNSPNHLCAAVVDGLVGTRELVGSSGVSRGARARRPACRAAAREAMAQPKPGLTLSGESHFSARGRREMASVRVQVPDDDSICVVR